MYVSSSSSAIRNREPGYSISFERKKQYEQSRLQTAPVGFASRWNARGGAVAAAPGARSSTISGSLAAPTTGRITQTGRPGARALDEPVTLGLAAVPVALLGATVGPRRRGALSLRRPGRSRRLSFPRRGSTRHRPSR